MSPTARHQCNVSSELCRPGTKPRGGVPAACERHAALFHMLCFFYQQPRSVIMLRLPTHKLHYHAIITLLENYDLALTSVRGYLFVFSCAFILLSQESDQCAIRARLGVAGYLSTTPRWGNPTNCFSQPHN